MSESESVENDLDNLLNAFYNNVANKEINKETLKELKKLRLSALELLKTHILFNINDDFTRNIIVKIIAKDLYNVDKELLLNAINTIKENKEIKSVLNYLLSYSNLIEIYDNGNSLDFYFKLNVKTREDNTSLHIGTIRFYVEDKILKAFLGDENNPMFEINTSEKTNNDYEKQIKGFIFMLDKHISKLEDALYGQCDT